MEALKNFDKQHSLIQKRIKEMDEESALVKALMSRLTFHALHMRKNLKKATSAPMCYKMCNKINEILSKYVVAMTEIGCIMERALCQGVCCWNSCYSSNRFIAKPLTCDSNSAGDRSHGQKGNDEKSPSTEEHLESEEMNCVKKMRDNKENFLNHQLPLPETNLTSDKVSERSFGNGSSSKNMKAVIKKEKLSIEEFNVEKLTEKEYYGHIENAVSPSELYVYFATKDIYLMEEFDKEIAALSEDAEYKSSNFCYSKKEIKDPRERKKKAVEELGDYGLCFLEKENLFHRVKIIDWNLSSDSDLIKVFFIDNGNKMNVSVDTVYPIPECLRKYPAFAVRCHLSGVVSEKGDGEWTPVEIRTLKKWMEENENVLIAIGEKESNVSGSLAIRVYDAKAGKSLNDLIRGSVDWEEESENVSSDWNPMREAYDSHLNSYEIDVDHPAIPVYGHIPKDYGRVCKIFRETGKCYKGDGCRNEHSVLDENGYTTDREEIFTNSFNSLDEPSVGDVLNVHITYIANGSQFYCVREDPESDGKEETLDSLVRYMNEGENVRNMKKLKIPPSAGQVVVCKFAFDDSWYRAKVSDASPEDDEYLVLFVDYGNTETVGFSSLRTIHPKYLHLPFQAMLCQIDGVQVKSDREMDAVKFLDDNLPVDVMIKVTGVFPGERPRLIVKLSSVDNWDVGRMLLRKKYAEPKESFILDESQDLFPG